MHYRAYHVAAMNDKRDEDILPKFSLNRLCEMQRKDPNLSAIINYLEKKTTS